MSPVFPKKHKMCELICLSIYEKHGAFLKNLMSKNYCITMRLKMEAYTSP